MARGFLIWLLDPLFPGRVPIACVYPIFMGILDKYDLRFKDGSRRASNLFIPGRWVYLERILRVELLKVQMERDGAIILFGVQEEGYWLMIQGCFGDNGR